ncbi:MAG: hypothetical protein EWV57_13275 [Microcystis aeruginosa Ma_QC_Ch_20071001_S25D]|uniref:Uncharacterized protein n=1 Tax=Microcystis aeruginosa Ma_QC_Ch_20071001_S25D TaxID=2486250 RepID=A0A552FQJ6_MICAE|nr:MAG: hypothetical protein EWV57_13275 [Microcystis aeruginosa Ma_QC_Ch_20071001_S25D]
MLKKFFGGGWGVGFYHLNFPPDHSHAGYFLIDKKSKSLTQQGFYIYSADPNYISCKNQKSSVR